MFKNWEILKKLNTEIFRIPLTPTKIFLILGETNLSYWGYCSTGRPFQNFGSVGRQNKNKQHFKIRQYCIVEKIMKNIFFILSNSTRYWCERQRDSSFHHFENISTLIFVAEKHFQNFLFKNRYFFLSVTKTGSVEPVGQ